MVLQEFIILRGNFSSIIGPFLFAQIIWAAILGNIFFSETLDLISLTVSEDKISDGTQVIFFIIFLKLYGC